MSANNAMKVISATWNFITYHKKLATAVAVVVIAAFIIQSIFAPKQATQQYQTAQVTKGTLVVSVSESGTVVVANRQAVTTGATGIVSEVDVKTGDSVTAGQTIAKLTLDQNGQQKEDVAWTSYLAAQNALSSAQADLNTLQVTLFKTNQAFVTDRGVNNPTQQQQADPVYIEENASWLAAQAAYINQQNVIAQATANVASTYLAYQQASSIITAPTEGILSDVTIAPGMQIAAPTSTTTVSSQTVAAIKTQGIPVITVSLSEIDVAKVKVGQQATITFDALPTQTFTGKVLGINTTGTVSNGVTTYPATIILDTQNDSILPNMSTTANIITNVKQNVLLVPSAAVSTSNGQSFVQVLQNNKPVSVAVTTGESSDSDTEITSGLSVGQTIVIGGLTNSAANATTSSPFGALRGGFGGGGAFFRTTVGGGGGRGG